MKGCHLGGGGCWGVWTQQWCVCGSVPLPCRCGFPAPLIPPPSAQGCRLWSQARGSQCSPGGAGAWQGNRVLWMRSETPRPKSAWCLVCRTSSRHCWDEVPAFNTTTNFWRKEQIGYVSLTSNSLNVQLSMKMKKYTPYCMCVCINAKKLIIILCAKILSFANIITIAKSSRISLKNTQELWSVRLTCILLVLTSNFTISLSCFIPNYYIVALLLEKQY